MMGTPFLRPNATVAERLTYIRWLVEREAVFIVVALFVHTCLVWTIAGVILSASPIPIAEADALPVVVFAVVGSALWWTPIFVEGVGHTLAEVREAWRRP